MRAIIVILTFIVCLSAEAKTFKYTSAQSNIYLASIKDGLIFSRANTRSQIIKEIRSQLKYLVGYFNHFTGVPELATSSIDIIYQQKVNADWSLIEYQVEMKISLPKKMSNFSKFELSLPATGTSNGLELFYQNEINKKCVDDIKKTTRGNVWYHYRPLLKGCEISSTKNINTWGSNVVRMEMQVNTTPVNSILKFPEYDQVWADGELQLTLIFGKDKHNTTSNNDVGVHTYRTMYNVLSQLLGKPSETNVPENTLVGLSTPYINLKFDTSRGPVRVHMALIGKVWKVDSQFREWLKRRTQVSDFISYNGHAGLGSNLVAFFRLGDYPSGQYTLFLINACDSFAYLENKLFDRFQRMNPSYGRYKFIDIISNAMPAYFHKIPYSNAAVIRALVEKKATYEEILGKFDPYQKALVKGEEDNRFPLPFY